uniref:uncharacterized protein n=1 Tax=Semicossyphus pulcher TaxID=241346 RepID=UPI0037E88C6A
MNIAIYNKDFGQRVNPGYQDNVEIKVSGLQNTSLVIREVTEQDEGCYRCLFNTYPGGALIGSTCLKLYELHGPVLDVRVSSEEAVVSCSATGRPAPTVTLSVLQLKLDSSDHVHTNTNGTVAVTRTAVLSRLHNNSARVECAVQVLSVPPKKVSVTIPEVEQTSADGVEAESGSDNSYIAWAIVVPVVIACVAAVLCLWKQQRKRTHSIQQGNEQTYTAQKENNFPEASSPTKGTPSIQRQSEQAGLRLQTPPAMKENNLPEASSPVVGTKTPLIAGVTPSMRQQSEQAGLRLQMSTAKKENNFPDTSSPIMGTKTPLIATPSTRHQSEQAGVRLRTSTAKKENKSPEASSPITGTPLIAGVAPLIKQQSEQAGLRLQTSTAEKKDNDFPEVPKSFPGVKCRRVLRPLFDNTK